MSEYWSLLAGMAVISLFLGAGLAWFNRRDRNQRLKSIRLVLIAFVAAAPTVLVVLGVLFGRDIRTPPERDSLANDIAEQIGTILSLIDIFAAIPLLCFLLCVRGSLSIEDKAPSFLLTACFLPLTFVSMLIGGQLLAGVSL